MNKVIRLVVVLIFMLAFVALGMNGTAWAGKLGIGNQSPVVSGHDQGLSVGVRPQGTVIGSPIIPVTGGQTGLTKQAITELPSGLTPPAGFKVVPTRITEYSGPGSSTTAAITFTLDPALVSPEIVSYWDGSKWVQLTATDGNYTIPVGAPLPLYVAVFTK